MMRLFDKLNTPVAVVLILAAILAVNGYLFYQQRASTSEASPSAEGTTSRVAGTIPVTTGPAPELEETTSENEERDENTKEDPEPKERTSEERTSEERTSEERTSEERTSEAEEPEDGPLAGLSEALDGCDGERERCARDFVSGVSPDARYIGGRTDLASGGSERNTEVLYFEDPEMKACRFERERYETESGVEYTVILVGAGSFEDERGEECIPEV